MKTGERKSLSYVLAEHSKTKICLINRAILVKKISKQSVEGTTFVLAAYEKNVKGKE